MDDGRPPSPCSPDESFDSTLTSPRLRPSKGDGGVQLSQQAAARLGENMSNFHLLVVLAPPMSPPHMPPPPMRLHPCQHCPSYHLALPLLNMQLPPLLPTMASLMWMKRMLRTIPILEAGLDPTPTRTMTSRRISMIFLSTLTNAAAVTTRPQRLLSFLMP
jgi:hypothetical protein